MSNIKDKIREWEISAHRYSKFDRNERSQYFDSFLSYNKPFVDFLVNFYDIKNKYILDYGCGTGYFAQLFRNHSKSVAGCDISSNMLSFAREKTTNDINYLRSFL